MADTNDHTHDEEDAGDHYDDGPSAYDILISDDPLTVEKAKQVLDIIRSYSDDPEAAHSVESTLNSVFVSDIACGKLTDMATIKAIAEVIQEVKAVKFPRYFA